MAFGVSRSYFLNSGSPSVNWEETVKILQTAQSGMREHTFAAGHKLALILRGGEERF